VIVKALGLSRSAYGVLEVADQAGGIVLGYTRRHLFIVLATALCVVGIVWLSLGIFIPTPPTKISIAGSFKGGHFESLALRYKDILARAHVEVTVFAVSALETN
jgi:hypothetical protein